MGIFRRSQSVGQAVMPADAMRAISADIPTAIPPGDDAVPPCYAPGHPAFDLTSGGLAVWANSSQYKSVLALARTYEAYHSLQSDESRAILYHLIVTLRPERVLEIGTFRAGTARFLAQALHHAGRGLLYTVDPFGIENNVPEIIASWPVHLRHHVRFSPVASSAFFDKAMSNGLKLDLVLVDGNHEFEFAAFDLACAARLINAGGIVVMDNVDQPGPRYAAQQFLAANPSWDEIKGAIVELVAENSATSHMPAFPQMRDYRLDWEAIEGLSVEATGGSPLAGMPALNLQATPTDGAHRLGVHFSNLPVNRDYRVVVWLSPSQGAHAMVDLREGRAPYSQIFCDLQKSKVVRQTGPVSVARIERDGDSWRRLLIDFNCPSGEGSLYVGVLGAEKGDVLFDGKDGAALNFGGVEIRSRNDAGEYQRPQPLSGVRFASRDLRALDPSDPLAFVAPSFPDTKFFVVKAPDGLEIPRIPRSFGSIISEASGAKWLELELATRDSGRLHYQIFCRAFSDVLEPEELTSIGSARIEPTQVDKIRIKLAKPITLRMGREQGYYRIEIILAFISDEAEGRLHLRQPPATSEYD